MKDYLKSALVCDTELLHVMAVKLERVSHSLERRKEVMVEQIETDEMDVEALKVNIHWLKRYKERVAGILEDLDYMVEQIEDTIDEM